MTTIGIKSIYVNLDELVNAICCHSTGIEQCIFFEKYLRRVLANTLIFEKPEKFFEQLSDPVKKTIRDYLLKEEKKEPEKKEEKEDLERRLWFLLSEDGDENYEEIKRLIDEGVNINYDYESIYACEFPSVYLAIMYNSPKTLRLLLENGGDIYLRTSQGRSVYDLVLSRKKRGESEYYDIICEFHPDLKEKEEPKEEPQEEIFYEIGTRFKRITTRGEKENYILAALDCCIVALICLEDGEMWGTSLTVSDNYRITENEFKELVGGKAPQFIKQSPNNED